jgi:hypothetical protein
MLARRSDLPARCAEGVMLLYQMLARDLPIGFSDIIRVAAPSIAFALSTSNAEQENDIVLPRLFRYRKEGR